MIKVKNENVKKVDHKYDYELENGVFLHTNDWNGEKYLKGYKETETGFEETGYSYRPVEKENTKNSTWEVQGFDELP